MYQRVLCKDGFSVSIQGNSRNYCEPRNDVGPYTAVELGFPSSSDSLITKYAESVMTDPTEAVYGWVPVGVVKALLMKHGGIEEGTLPPFDWTPEQSVILAETLNKNEGI
jgi:hypothetical protein